MYPLSADPFHSGTCHGRSGDAGESGIRDSQRLKGLLQHYHILNDEEPHLGENKYQFYVSDGAEKFKHFANSIIKYGILSAKTIKIDEY